MKTTYTIDLSSGTSEATVIIESPLIGLSTWKCIEGEEVWGNPVGGVVIKGPSGELFLGAGAGTLGVSTLDNFYPAKISKTGVGSKTELPGQEQGSFPEGDFDWEISKVS
jgi:hypothetical protein